MSEWISTKDKLPNPDDYVLCRCYGWYHCFQFKMEHTSDSTKVWFEQYLSADIDSKYSLKGVTHWQPIPEFKEAETNGDDCRESGMEQTNNESAE